jgi:hypothetical protein
MIMACRRIVERCMPSCCRSAPPYEFLARSIGHAEMPDDGQRDYFV